MNKMDNQQTKQFVRSIVTAWEAVWSDPTEDVFLCQNMIDSFPTSSDAVLDDLRRQALDMQLLFNQAQAQLLTYCQRQVAEMNQNKAQGS